MEKTFCTQSIPLLKTAARKPTCSGLGLGLGLGLKTAARRPTWHGAPWQVQVRGRSEASVRWAARAPAHRLMLHARIQLKGRGDS